MKIIATLLGGLAVGIAASGVTLLCFATSIGLVVW